MLPVALVEAVLEEQDMLKRLKLVRPSRGSSAVRGADSAHACETFFDFRFCKGRSSSSQVCLAVPSSFADWRS